MYPRLRPPQRGQTKPFGHRCAVRCSPHRTSSPKRERNSLTVMMDFRFNGLGFFISDILSPFVRLFKLDIHPEKAGVGGSTPSLATIILKNLAHIRTRPPSPLSVRYFSTRSGSVPGHDDGEALNLDCLSLSPLLSAAWLKIATSIAPAAAMRSSLTLWV